VLFFSGGTSWHTRHSGSSTLHCAVRGSPAAVVYAAATRTSSTSGTHAARGWKVRGMMSGVAPPRSVATCAAVCLAMTHDGTCRLMLTLLSLSAPV